MNYLAHLLLSGPSAEWRMGGFLGDFVKGPLPAVGSPSEAGPTIWSPGVLAGIHLHRQIDAYVDHHETYQRSLRRLGSGHRRIGGIILDIAFDHMLARHWHEFVVQPLPDFEQQVWQDLSQVEQLGCPVPENAKQFMQRASSALLLSAYSQPSTLEAVFTRVADRLRKPDLLDGAIRLIDQHRSALYADFVELLPELQAFSSHRRVQLGGED